MSKYVKPSRDEVARAIDPVSWRYFDSGMFPPTHPASLAAVRRSRDQADAVLALWPGRTEAEVKAESLRPLLAFMADVSSESMGPTYAGEHEVLVGIRAALTRADS